MNANDMIALAQRTLAIEQEALGECAARIDAQFARAVQICLACTGRIVVTGMGKSGHVGHKIAATLASTGSPAFFVHPARPATAI